MVIYLFVYIKFVIVIEKYKIIIIIIKKYNNNNTLEVIIETRLKIITIIIMYLASFSLKGSLLQRMATFTLKSWLLSKLNINHFDSIFKYNWNLQKKFILKW